MQNEQFIQTSGNTINLWYHLQQKYPDIYAIEMITSDTSDSSNVSQKWKKKTGIFLKFYNSMFW